MNQMQNEIDGEIAGYLDQRQGKEDEGVHEDQVQPFPRWRSQHFHRTTRA